MNHESRAVLICPRQLSKLLCELACRQHHILFLSTELGCRGQSLDTPAISQAEIAIVLTCSDSNLPTSKLHLKLFFKFYSSGVAVALLLQ